MPNTNRRPRLRKFEIEALASVRFGADVASYELAQTLRSVEARRPDLLHIVPPMKSYSVKQQLPYFGVIASWKGQGYLDRHFAKEGA